ncbi:MAG: SPFH domain / band 7 family protein [Bacteriophage sp.]|nr:MAG: SPFH domain / band 7 family protein [Bacteriophage sp.]
MKKGLLGGIGLAAVIVAGLICVAKCSVRVPAGYIAVEYKMNGGISKNVLTQGWHLISPTVKTSLYSVGIEQSYLTSEDKGDSPKDESFKTPTADGKSLLVDLEFSYKFDQSRVTDVFTQFKGQSGESVKNTFIKPKMKAWTQEVTAKYPVTDVFGDKRQELNEALDEYLKRKFEPLRPSWGVGWQYSSKATIPGINTKVDRNIFYKDYTEAKESGTMAKTKEQIIQNVKNDAVSFAVNIANDNSHGYSQRIRSLYEINIPKSFDCSSLALTAYYYAFLKNGLTKQARYLKENCSYTGNMLKMLNAGFEVVARNQTAHKQMIKGDLELADNNPNGSNSHVAMAIGKNDIVHARSSEGTKDTKDNSGNEIRTQPWYLYSHGWTHRLRFTGKGIDFSGLTNTTGSKPTAKPSTSTKPSTTTSKGAGYMFEPKLVKLGSEGTSVLLLQEILIARGFKGKNGKALSLSRKADDNTIYALKRYQKSRNGVLVVDGECGEKTWKDLIAI